VSATHTPSGPPAPPQLSLSGDGNEVVRQRAIQQDQRRRRFQSDADLEWPRDSPQLRTDWTRAGMLLSAWTCYLVFGLSAAYVPTMVIGFVSQGGLARPLGDPFLAIMELLILLLAPALVVVFATVHMYAAPAKRILSLSALVFVALMAGITVSEHTVLLTVGRQANEATLPGFARLFSWTWPSATYALDIVAWDLFLGLALVLASPVFGQGRLEGWVRKGLLLSGTLCLVGLIGMPLGNMQFRDIGIIGYAGVLPVVMLLMARIFGRLAALDLPDDVIQEGPFRDGVPLP
jgi:hypothetical protein